MSDKIKTNSFLANFKIFLDETDIRILVFVPPGIFVGVVFLGNLIATAFPKITIPLSLLYVGMSILIIGMSFSGIAEIYKKEMPGPMGGITRGKIAVISGIIKIVLPVVAGSVILISTIYDILK